MKLIDRLFRRFDVTGTSPGDVYMRRWTIIGCRWFSVRIHKFMRSDHDVMHDHPWDFVSLILKGGYYEITTDDPSEPVTAIAYGEDSVHHVRYRKTWYRIGRVLRRKAENRHRVVLKVDKIQCIDCVLREVDPEFAAHAGMCDVLTGETLCECYHRTRVCWTLCITGPKIREWGFWCERGWVAWRDFFAKAGCSE